MRRLGLIAVAALALVPCASAAGKNPCALVKSAEAAKALGVAVGAGKREKHPVFDTCTYAKGRKSITVQTRQISHAGYRGAVKRIHGTALNATDISPDAWVFFVPKGISLAVWKRGTQVNLQVLGAGNDASTVVKDVATVALRRI